MHNADNEVTSRQMLDMAAALRNSPAEALRESGYLDRAADYFESIEAATCVPGVLRCAKCDFRLVKTTLNMVDGNAYANDEPDQCPNCNVPMWRVSWKDEAKDAYKVAGSQMDRALAAEAAYREKDAEIAGWRQKWIRSTERCRDMKHERDQLRAKLDDATRVQDVFAAALDIADRLIERGYGLDTPEEWHKAFRSAANARAAAPAPLVSKEQAIKLAEMEGDAEIGAGMPDHLLRRPDAVARAPWRKVTKRGGLTRAYRGRNSSARYVILECGHQVRLTGDRALTPPERMRCGECGECR